MIDEVLRRKENSPRRWCSKPPNLYASSIPPQHPYNGRIPRRRGSGSADAAGHPFAGVVGRFLMRGKETNAGRGEDPRGGGQPAARG